MEPPGERGSKKGEPSIKLGVTENPSPWKGRPRESGSPKNTGDQARGSQKGKEAHTGRPEAAGGSEDKVPWR